MPVDGSIHTLRAVDHMSHMLAGVKDVDITLFHSSAWLFSNKEQDNTEACELFGQEWCEDHLNQPDAYFHAPEQILRDNGFDMSRVRRGTEGRGLEPARDIALQLRHKQFGTIVMGRRGPKEPKGILGGVSDRVLQTVNNVMVWLVD